MPPRAVPVAPAKLAELMAKDEDSPYKIAIVLMIAAGIRRGEALGLRWKNVDLDAGIIRIEEQRVPLTGGAYFTEPKSASGKRTIKLPNEAVERLRAHRVAVAETLFGYRKRLSPETTVVCGTLGNPLDPNSFGSWARRRGIKLHNIRHAHLSALANSGIPIAAVSKRAGHSTIATTIATYIHPREEDDEAAAVVAGGLMGSR
jgi:integrase